MKHWTVALGNVRDTFHPPLNFANFTEVSHSVFLRVVYESLSFTVKGSAYS